MEIDAMSNTLGMRSDVTLVSMFGFDVSYSS